MTGDSFPKGCLIAVAVLFIVAAVGSLLVWNNRHAITSSLEEAFELPAYGEREHIDKVYGASLRSLDAAADKATSVFSFGAAVEAMTLPDEVIYVGFEKGDDETAVIKKFDWSSTSFLIVRNYGAGTLSDTNASKDVMIYRNDGSWGYMDRFVVYIEHTGDAPAKAE